MQQRSDGLIVPHFPDHDRYKWPNGMWKGRDFEKIRHRFEKSALTPMDKEALCAIYNNGGILSFMNPSFSVPLKEKGLIKLHMNPEMPWRCTHITLTVKGRKAAQEIMKNHVMGVEF